MLSAIESFNIKCFWRPHNFVLKCSPELENEPDPLALCIALDRLHVYNNFVLRTT